MINNSKQNPKQAVKDLSVKIKSITRTGLVSVVFNQAINIPGNYSNFENDILSVQVIPGP
jgi:hypothetical protein